MTDSVVLIFRFTVGVASGIVGVLVRRSFDTLISLTTLGHITPGFDTFAPFFGGLCVVFIYLAIIGRIRIHIELLA